MAGPFDAAYTKHVAHQNVGYQLIGDSTIAGNWTPATNWCNQLAGLMGPKFNQTVRTRAFQEWFGPPYAEWATKYTGSGDGTVSIHNGSQNGQGLTKHISWVTDGTVLNTAVDVIIHGSVANDVIAGLSIPAYIDLYDTLIGAVQTAAPGVPFIIITQHPWDPIYEATFVSYHQALLSHLGVGAIPMTPYVQKSTTKTDVWVMDTRWAFGQVYNPLLMAESLHQSVAGNAAQAQWTLDRILEASSDNPDDPDDPDDPGEPAGPFLGDQILNAKCRKIGLWYPVSPRVRVSGSFMQGILRH